MGATTKPMMKDRMTFKVVVVVTDFPDEEELAALKVAMEAEGITLDLAAAVPGIAVVSMLWIKETLETQKNSQLSKSRV